jgi:hypothetical protein
LIKIGCSRISKPDLAVALLGLPAGAAVDVWFFPGGTLDPFSTGLYFCAAAVGAKYAVESLMVSKPVQVWLRGRAKRRMDKLIAEHEKKDASKAATPDADRFITTEVERGLAKRNVTTYFNVVTAALDSVDDRHPADREKCQNYKARLEAQHRSWEADNLAYGDMMGDIRWAMEKYNDVINARRSFLEGTEGTRERSEPAAG